jgi:phosphatidylserine decarboxylase
MVAAALRQLSQQEQINFLLTNRIPRRALTQAMGWLSRIENRPLARLVIGAWRLWDRDLDLEEAETRHFDSLQDCFTRRLKPGARVIDARPGIVASPCDAVVGECGAIAGTTVFQAKGFPYELGDLMPRSEHQERFRDGQYVTLRLRASMYHRFHAPVDCRVETIDYISGDTWNVNPIALRRIEKLYCRNERSVVPLSATATSGSLCLVPIAAILVASMRFVGVDERLDLRYRGPNRIACHRSFRKGEEMGHFEHGSTIILFATGQYRLCEGIATGTTVRMGQGLLIDTLYRANPESP